MFHPLLVKPSPQSKAPHQKLFSSCPTKPSADATNDAMTQLIMELHRIVAVTPDNHVKLSKTTAAIIPTSACTLVAREQTRLQQHSHTRHSVNKRFYTAALKSLEKPTLRAINLPLPPLSKQKSIFAVIHPRRHTRHIFKES